jgi:hypothetical protein
MKVANEVEFADWLARRRAIGLVVAALVYVAVQVIARPVLIDDVAARTAPRSYLWVANSVVLLCLLLPITAFVWGRRIRELVNDEVSRLHATKAFVVAFLVAMTVALSVFVIPALADLQAREVSYLIVTPATVIAVLCFAWLETRAMRDG